MVVQKCFILHSTSNNTLLITYNISTQKLQCSTCQYIGHNERSLEQHIKNNESCKSQKKILPNVSSITFNQYSTDGIVDNIQLNIKGDTREK